MREDDSDRDRHVSGQEEEFTNGGGGIVHRVMGYGVVAIAVVAVTWAVLLFSAKYTFRMNLRDIDSFLNLLLLFLSLLLLVLVVAKIVAKILRKGTPAPTRQVAEGGRESRVQPLGLEGSYANLFGTYVEIPDTLSSLADHILRFHRDDLIEATRRMMSASGGGLPRQAAYILAFLELMSLHLDEARTSLYESAARAGEIVLSDLA